MADGLTDGPRGGPETGIAGARAQPAEERRAARRRRSRRHNPDGTMTVVEHLLELRRRLAFALVAVAIGAIAGFVWWQHGIGSIPSLGTLISGPYCSLPSSTRVTFGNHPCALLQTKPFEGFSIRLKVGVAAGVVLTSPAWLYQLWAFITPGLYKGERRFALTFVSCAVILFVGGAVLAYLVVPEALRVLTNVGGNQFVTALAGTDYVSFILALLAIFGASFELPLVIVMLNRIGVIKYEKLKSWRRGIVFLLFVFAAFVTPGQDPISMSVLAGGLTILFELAVQVSRVHDKRLARRRLAEGWDGLEDDQASPLEYLGESERAVAPPVRDTRSISYDDAT